VPENTVNSSSANILKNRLVATVDKVKLSYDYFQYNNIANFTGGLFTFASLLMGHLS